MCTRGGRRGRSGISGEQELTGLLRVEALLNSGQEILGLAGGIGNEVRLLRRQPFVLQCFLSRRSISGIDSETVLDKALSHVGNVLPVFRCTV